LSIFIIFLEKEACPVTLNALFALFSALLGAALGSFFDAVAERSAQDRSWWGRERSRCPSCGKELGPGELVPIVSFLVQKGRCRRCEAPIPKRSLAVEIVCAVGAGLLAWRWGPGWAGLLALAVFFSLAFNALTDIHSGYIYDVTALLPILPFALLRSAGGLPALFDGAVGALLGFAVVAVIIIASRGGMGWGDAMLMAGCGAGLGWRLTGLALYLGFMVGGIVALALLVLRKVERKTALPLAPFLAVGAFLALLLGPSILSYWRWGAGWPW
jgi:leader peptidase (prepilin peptidase)/N-methyltransferase